MSRVLFGLVLVLVVCCICYVSADKFDDDVLRYTETGLTPAQIECGCRESKYSCDYRRDTVRLYAKIIARQVDCLEDRNNLYDDCRYSRSFVCGDHPVILSEITEMSGGRVNCSYVGVLLHLITRYMVCCDVSV